MINSFYYMFTSLYKHLILKLASFFSVVLVIFHISEQYRSTGIMLLLKILILAFVFIPFDDIAERQHSPSICHLWQSTSMYRAPAATWRWLDGPQHQGTLSSRTRHKDGRQGRYAAVHGCCVDVRGGCVDGWGCVDERVVLMRGSCVDVRGQCWWEGVVLMWGGCVGGRGLCWW